MCFPTPGLPEGGGFVCLFLGGQTKPRAELDRGSWGQSQVAAGGGSSLRLYLCGDTGVLCPELGSEVQVLSWSWGRLVLQRSGVSVG